MQKGEQQQAASWDSATPLNMFLFDKFSELQILGFKA
jgi:hypothetical protein